MDAPIPPRPSTNSPLSAISYLPTKAAYARWAATYDSDGNALQAMDDIQLRSLLPAFLSLLAPAAAPPPSSDPSSGPLIIDLGCGTGRNTAKLLSVPGARVLGLDASPEMLAVARPRCADVRTTLDTEARCASVDFGEWDALGSGSGAAVAEKGTADALISTLVVEHIPLQAFFGAVATFLRPGGYALVTNMHADMGARSQAGFNDKVTGEKVRPVSYAHLVADVVKVAGENGLRVVEDGLKEAGGVWERVVEEEMIETGELGERARKWIGTKTWFGVVLRKDGSQ